MSYTPQEQAPRFNSNARGLFPQHRTPLQLRQSQNGPYANLRLPSVEEAYQLLDTVLLYLCGTQHYFDERELSDQLRTYSTEQVNQLKTQNALVKRAAETAHDITNFASSSYGTAHVKVQALSDTMLAELQKIQVTLCPFI